VTSQDTTQQEKPAFDVTVDFTERADAGKKDAVRYRWHERFVVSKEKDAYWRLRVSMPGGGKFAAEGEQLFNDVAKNLKILDLQQ
jgi:hypothetical protein